MEILNNFYELSWGYNHYTVSLLFISVGIMILSIPFNYSKHEKLSNFFHVAMGIINLFAIIFLLLNIAATNNVIQKISCIFVLAVLVLTFYDLLIHFGKKDIATKRFTYIISFVFSLAYIVISLFLIFKIIMN
jgi:hypothetical protein